MVGKYIATHLSGSWLKLGYFFRTFHWHFFASGNLAERLDYDRQRSQDQLVLKL